MTDYRNWSYTQLRDMIGRYREEIRTGQDADLRRQLIITLQRMQEEMDRRERSTDTRLM